MCGTKHYERHFGSIVVQTCQISLASMSGFDVIGGDDHDVAGDLDGDHDAAGFDVIESDAAPPRRANVDGNQ